MDSEVEMSIPAYPEEQLANPDFCIGKRKDSEDNVSHVGMKIHLHIDSHGNRSALRTHLGYLKESYDTALFWHAKAMSLELLSAENKKKGKKWKKQLDRKYEQYVDVAKAYFDTTKRKRKNSVPETETQPIQLPNPIVMPAPEILEPILVPHNQHQPSIAQSTSSLVNFQRCSTYHATSLLSRVRPDSWIGSQPSENQMYVPIARPPYAQPSAQLPQIKLPVFSGDPKTWLNFASSFHTLIHQHSSDNSYRIAMLRESLSPIIQKCLGSLLMDPSLYEHALSELKHVYGDPLLIAKAHLSELKGLPSVPRNNPEALQYFVAQLSSLVSGIMNQNFRHELQSSMLLTELASKVPSKLQVKWATKLSSLRGQQIIPSVEHFLDCMEEAAEFERTLFDCISIDNIVLPPHETIPAKKSRIDDPHSKEKQASIKSNTKQSKPSTYSFAIDSTASRCMYCEQSHKPLSCRNYSNLSLEDRAERVRKHKACYRCLESTHLGRNCKRNEPCNINGCRAIHHPSIHGYGRIWKETAIENEMPPRNASREESLMETSTAESEASS